jgi:serine/threonine protein kinase
MLLPSVPGAKITVNTPPIQGGPSLPLEAGGGGVAGLGLLLLILGLVSGKSASITPSTSAGLVPASTSYHQLATAQTAASMGAAGTPAAIDSQQGFTTSNLGPGRMIGRWEVIRRIGSGGMADVYLARARGEGGFEKLVAVKVMHPHLARNERAVEHFLDEAKLAARITHPNVVQIQDLGKIGNDYVIVMEYVDGVDLEKLLAAARASQRPLPLDIGLGILCRICDGLNAAHRATSTDGAPMNLVHRDVKTANVLVSRQGGVKVVDFGIAKAASQNHQTMAGETKGTPSMMAPEQRVGEEVDMRADVYSVGAVAFEILTNHGVNLDLATLAHLGVENWPHLPMPSTLRGGLPVELDTLLMSCMAYDRARRPADCAALEAAFEAVMKKHALTASDKDIARWVVSETAAWVGSANNPAEPHAPSS